MMDAKIERLTIERDRAYAENERLCEMLVKDGVEWWVIAIRHELSHARRKFPNPDNLTGALAEEAGEVIKESMHFYHGEPERDMYHLSRECIHTAAMAIRLAEEGDPMFKVPGGAG